MSTNPVTPKPTVGSVLNSISQVGGYIGLAVQIGEVLVPIGKALVTKIKGASGQTTLTYSLLVEQDQAELLDVDALAKADLAAINAELVRQGAKPLPVGG